MKVPVGVLETSLFTANPDVWFHFLFTFSAHILVDPGTMAAAQANCCTTMPLKHRLFMSSAHSAA